MKKIVLHRTLVMDEHIQGYITIEGTNFSCYSLEAQCVEGHNPINPQFAYALPCGTYKIKIDSNSFYPIVPFIIAPKYRRISFIQQEDRRIRPGCIAIGNKFRTPRFLDGAGTVFDALRTIIIKDWQEWKKDAYIEIVNDDIIEYVNNDGEELEEEDEDFNFLNI